MVWPDTARHQGRKELARNQKGKTVKRPCDMMPVCQKYAVREALQKRPVLDNGLLDTFPQQPISIE
jgi:hypothetical protein